MTKDQLKAWRARVGLSQRGASQAMGISLRQYGAYERSEAKIPPLVEWATIGIELSTGVAR